MHFLHYNENRNENAIVYCLKYPALAWRIEVIRAGKRVCQQTRLGWDIGMVFPVGC